MAKIHERVGEVRRRSQVYDPRNGRWVKRDAATGRFMDQKAERDRAFKGVRREPSARKRRA